MNKGFVIWLTGLPCSGKTTLANALEEELRRRGHFPNVLDGDALRRTISADLGYSPEDRKTHVEGVTTLARSVADAGFPAIVALISPYRSMREKARKEIGAFVEVYVRCPLNVCESRDVKN